MPTFSFTFSDAALAEFVAAVSTFYGYQATLSDGTANPETRAQFARRMVMTDWKRRVLVYRQQVAAQTAPTTDPEIT